jgi:hypothetical protein
MATERDLFKGRIVRYTRIECADCTAMDERQTAHRPMAFFVKWGWRKHGGLWRCPDCVKGDAR